MSVASRVNNLTTQDVVNCRAALHRQRRKHYSTLPRSLLETIEEKLRVMPMSTHKGEDFLMYCEAFNNNYAIYWIACFY